MVLEATMVCVDNSEWMRNGDFTPTRFEVRHTFGGSRVRFSPYFEWDVDVLELF